MIRDGTGKGYMAKVNNDNELKVITHSIQSYTCAAVKEEYYEATTGQITLTTDTETGIVYIGNTNPLLHCIVDRVFYDIWGTTGGDTAGGILKYYRNPSYTGGTDIVPVASNFGSRKSMTGVFLKSLTTLTGTAWWTALITPMTSNVSDEGRIVIPPSSTFGISIKAPTGNTSMKVSINVAMYMFDILEF
jgi:hypothetical protein